MIRELGVILNYVRNDFQKLEDLKMVDQKSLIEVIKQHKLVTYITAFDKKMLSQELKIEIKSLSLECNQRITQIQYLVNELYNFTRSRELDFAVIKGPALNYCLYGAEDIRTYGDLDILIKEEQANKFHELLVEQGFLQKKGPTTISVSRDRSSRAYTAFYAKQMKQYYLTMYPVRTHQNKPEYAPYCKDNFPCIELHNGMYFMNDSSVKKCFKKFALLIKRNICYRL